MTSSGSDILADKLEPFDAVKTTLTGDYSHLKEAIDKTKNYVNTNKITVNPAFTHLEILKINRFDIKNSSKWITEVYVPIQPKITPVNPTVVPSTSQRVTPVRTPATPPVVEEDDSEF